jgi:AraC family transcriptional regulator of adaptative response / DNA-3-methyladenine glycosylase II
MSARADSPPATQASVYARALDARDARFDGIFFVGITTTRIYCRPVCPARVAYHSHRRFFDSAAAAELAGFRPCLRCRPELAPGRAAVDAISRIARTAEQRIAAGALNGRSVAELASEMGVSERHLRRALERTLGISPIRLAQTHRLLFAKRLLADTALPVTQIAFASGFQSLRRFNACFREQYRLPPSAVRRVPRATSKTVAAATDPAREFLRLTLAYRAPLAWDVLVSCLAGDAIGGVETVMGRRYGRTIEIGGRTGVIFAEDADDPASQARSTYLNVDVSQQLVPALMPLLARLRQLFDLDVEPHAIDAHLAQGGLGTLVSVRPGVRIPGAVDGFDVALRALVRGRSRNARRGSVEDGGPQSSDPAARVAWALGAPIDTGDPRLARLSPIAARVAEAGSARLVALGVPQPRAEAAVALARAVADGSLRLEPGGDVAETTRVLTGIPGVGEQMAAMLVSRALRWPDLLPGNDRALQRSAGAVTSRALLARAQRWRPWCAYAAQHLWLHDESHGGLVPPCDEPDDIPSPAAAPARRRHDTPTSIAS